MLGTKQKTLYSPLLSIILNISTSPLSGKQKKKKKGKLRESRKLILKMNHHCEGRTLESSGFLFHIAMGLFGPNKSYHIRAILLKSLPRKNCPQNLGLK